MHLIETYSSSCRLKIDRPFITEKYFPISFDKYICLQCFGGMESKNYSYFQEIIDLIKPILDKYKINIIQLGAKGENGLNGVINLCGQTNLGQSYYILKRSLLHCGIDSTLIHFCSSMNKKIVGIYSLSSPKICGPYDFDGNSKNHICLEPEFESGHTYSFNPQENPAYVNTIKPEKVANAIFELLDLEERIKIESLYFGKDYKNSSFETIPNHIVHPQNFPNATLQIRGDLFFDENGIYGNIAHRPCSIVVNQPLNIDILKQYKHNVKDVIYLLSIQNKERDLPFIKKLHESGLNYLLLTTDKDNINQLKFDYLDFNPVLELPICKKQDIKQREKISELTYFRTNKFILSEGKIYNSRAHWEKNIPYDPQQKSRIIDCESFWMDLDYFWLYNENI